MSLKVWLPLDGSLKNLGASNVTISSGTAAYGTGKIGSNSLDLINSTQTNLSCPELANVSTFSICCWIKGSKDTSDADWVSPIRFGVNKAGGTENYDFRFGKHDNASGTEGYPVGVYHNSPNTISNKNNTFTTAEDWGKWVHVCFVYDGVNIKGYKNGAEVFNHTNGQGGYLTGNFRFRVGRCNWLVNDFRIYDHCLSAAEVHEISQGLVLHYKLDGGMFGNSNLLTNTEKLDATGLRPSTVPITENGYQNFTTVTYDNTSGTSYKELLYWNGKVTVNINEVYTTSFYAKSPVSAILTCYFYNNTSGVVQNQSAIASTGATSTSADGAISISLTPEWKRYWVTWTFNSTGTAATKSLLFRSMKGRGEISICGVKLEKGNAATPWCPADSELGASRSIEDSSGYGHQSTITGTPTISTDSPRYSCCTHFTSGQMITTNGLFTTPNPIFTVNFWVKMYSNTYTAWKDVMTFTGNKQFRMEVNNASGQRLAWYNYPIGTSNGILNANVNYDEWNMLTLVWNGSSIITYKNGVQITSVTISGTEWIPDGGFSIGDSGMYMYMSDARIYCTALSSEDILALYHTGAKVDNKNNVHSFELNENDENQITKTGQIKCSTFTEFEGLSYLKYDPNLYIEPDGSCWVRVYHHNNPSGGSFASTDDFAHSVYIDENRWFNMELANHLDKWEIMVKGKFTSTSAEWKLRWIQQYNPMTATYANVAVANITKITDGYSSSPTSWGGLYAKKGGAYLTTNNGNSGNWWGAVGSYSVYQNGIPGWGPTSTITTTGFNDIYLRIDNVTITSPAAKITKNKLWTGSQIIEF